MNDQRGTPNPDPVPSSPSPAKPDLAATVDATRVSSASALAEAELLAQAAVGKHGRFKIIRHHAQGGLGDVYLAEDEELHRQVALKRVQERFAESPQHRRRFIREAILTGQLEHPGIVPVYGLVSGTDGKPSYAMRFIQGDSLRAAIHRFYDPVERSNDLGVRRVAFRQLLQRFVAACNALAYAHNRGIVHRDVKPANIMLGPYGETLVVDWGLAKEMAEMQAVVEEGVKSAEDSSFPPLGMSAANSAATPTAPPIGTQMGEALGTPAYMAPEQAAGRWEAVGPTSDIYSLGATLYELLTGEKPLQGDDIFDVLDKAQRGAIPPPRQRRRDVPRGLEQVCLKALALRPEDRYPTAKALAEDVEHWLADEPVSAWREPQLFRAARWVRRHRNTVAVGSVALLLCMASIFGGLYFRETEKQRRELAVQEHQVGVQRGGEASDEIGLMELRAGRFLSAERIYGKAAESLKFEPSLAQLWKKLAARHDQAHRLSEFQLRVQAGERLILRNYNEEVIDAFEQGLALLHVMDHPTDWWKHLPTTDLTEAQVKTLESEVHLRLLILATLRARRGPMQGGDKSAMTQGLQSALIAIDMAQNYRKCQLGHGLEFIARLLLSDSRCFKAKAEFLASQPTTAADHYLIGMLHFWAAQMPDEILNNYIFQILNPLSVFDFKTPRATAERHFRMASSLAPDHYWTYHWLGQTLTSSNKPDAAELAHAACIGLRPDYVEGYVGRAMSLIRQMPSATKPEFRNQLFSRALMDFDVAIRLEPNDYMPLHYRGEAYQRNGEYLHALADHSRAIELGNRMAKPEANFFECHLSRGQCHMALGHLDSALADFDAALRHFPAHIKGGQQEPSRIYAAQASVHLVQGKFDQAIAELSKAITHRANAKYFDQRGSAFIAKNEFGSALSDFTAAVKLEPANAGRHYALGMARLASGDEEGYRQVCEATLRQIQSTADTDGQALVVRLCVARPGSVADLKQLVRLAETVVQAKPQEMATLEILAAAHYRAGEYQAAVNRFDEAGNMRGQASLSVEAGFFLAMAHHRLGHVVEADQFLTQAVERMDKAKDPAWTDQNLWRTLRQEAEKISKR